ncbi:MAG: hypothetical protein QXV37_02650 [Candidatus Jordarchaeaceae archaeon]
MELAKKLNEKYHLPEEWLHERLIKSFESISLTNSGSEKLFELILKRCELSIEIAKLKAEEAVYLPEGCQGLLDFVRKKEIEEAILSKVLEKINYNVTDKMAIIKDFVEFLFELSRKLQVMYLLELREKRK